MVASFTEEKHALNGYKKLNELEALGNISLYDKIMVRKNSNGDYETLKGDSSEGWRAFGGMAVGGLLGALGGPIGLVIGLYAGIVIGSISEAYHYDFANDFVKNIETGVAPGTVSIIAEIDEDDHDFIEQSLQPFGAIVWTTNVDYAYDDYSIDQVEEIEEDIAVQRAELKKSIGKEKEKIEQKITELKEKRKIKLAEFDADFKKAAADVQQATASGIKDAKKQVKAIGQKLDDAVKESKSSHIKNSIARHESMLKRLQHDLKELA